jgi:Mg-chelatase subunit ChlD
MNTKLIGAALFAFTAAAVAFYPTHQAPAVPVPKVQFVPKQTPNARPRIDVVFVLDTTGSMSGLIDAAKTKIWSIATTMAQANPAPEIRIGLVAYRDRGDDYVTKIVDLSSDLDSVYAKLMDFQAGGGGDGPESVNQALNEAVNKLAWSADQGTYKVVFLVGDAPPHMDYDNDVKYPATLALAKQKGIVVNTIQCGAEQDTTPEWRNIAALAGGEYFMVEQNGSAVAMATPFDEKIAGLSAKLDATRLYYGSAEQQAEKAAKLAATEKLNAAAPAAALAGRAAFNVSASGAANLTGDHDLLEDVKTARVDLKAIPKAELPAALQRLAPEEREKAVKDQSAAREALKKEIASLSEQRAGYLRDEVEAKGGAASSLDDKLFGTVRAQAKDKGIAYPAAAPKY